MARQRATSYLLPKSRYTEAQAWAFARRKHADQLCEGVRFWVVKIAGPKARVRLLWHGGIGRSVIQ